MAEWVKLHSKISESEDFAALQAADPNAALLFLMSLPIAAPWGILPRSAAVFRGRVAPMFDLSLSQVETCLRLVLDQGMYLEYTDRDGKSHLYVTAWTQNQARQWDRVGPPPCDLPPAWEPPADIARAIAVSSKARRWLTVETLETHLQDAESKTRLRLILDQSETSLPREVRGRGERLETPTTNDLLPEADAPGDQIDPSLFPEEPIHQPDIDPKPKRTPAKRTVRPDDEVTADIAAQRTRLPTGCEDLLDAFLDIFAQANKSGSMARTRELTITTELADKAQRDGITTDALRHGLTAAIGKGAANVNYVVKAANGYDPEQHAQHLPTVGGNGRRFITCSDGTRVYENSEGWGYTQDLSVAEAQRAGIWNPRTGCTTEPSRGFCCDDGWFYSSRDDGSMYQDRRWRQ